MIQRIKDAIDVITDAKVARPKTIVHKVEIQVTSNRAPSQIARDVFAALVEKHRCNKAPIVNEPS